MAYAILGYGMSLLPRWVFIGCLLTVPAGALAQDAIITWGGMDEKADGCFPGLVRITVNGDKMNYEWSGTHNGQEYSAGGELRRVKKR
jgi:hypothetical protein